MVTPGKVLVTGASGFVGRGVVNRLSTGGWKVRASTRRELRGLPASVETAVVSDVGPDTDWADALNGVDAVVHCAARVHVLNETAADPLAEFRRINVAGTLNLASQAAKTGVRRFVFVSSIGVNGAETFGAPFRAEDRPNPDSPYALSKHEAELALRDLSERTGLEIVIVRPPLVFGPSAPGNFERLLRAIDRGVPLPFGAIRNRRSFVALDNLVDLIETCVRHPSAAGGVFLVSDGEDLSTTNLLRRTAAAMGRSITLIPVPTSIVRTGLRLLGRAELGQRLCGSLQVDIGPTTEALGWTPSIGIDRALEATARHYLQRGPRTGDVDFPR